MTAQYKYIFMLAAFAMTAAALQGQPYVTEQHKRADPYYRSDNAAVQMLGSRLLYSGISLGAELEGGSFHRPQQPADSHSYLFSTEGSVNLGKAYVSGGFDFTQAYQNQVKFNSIFDPYRGTPYIIADSTGGNWRKQSYNMWAKAAGPVIKDRLYYGVKIGLDVGRGAKITDPRPQANSNRIECVPSLALKLGRSSAIGASFNYARFQENANLMLYDTGTPQKLYMMKGMGQYVYMNFSTVEWIRKYGGNQLGGGAYYSFNNEKVSLLVTGEYKNYVEDASDIDNYKPRLRGRLYQTDYTAGLRLTIRGEGSQHTVTTGWLGSERSGREIIQRYENSPSVNRWVTESEAPRRSVTDETSVDAGYRVMFRPKDNVYQWQISLDGTYNDFSDTYEVLDSYIKYRSAKAALMAERLIEVKKMYFNIELGVFGRTVWGREMNYTYREADHTIGDGLVMPDYEIMTSNYAGASAGFTAGYKFKAGRSLWLKAAYSYTGTQNNRQYNNLGAAVGYSF